MLLELLATSLAARRLISECTESLLSRSRRVALGDNSVLMRIFLVSRCEICQLNRLRSLCKQISTIDTTTTTYLKGQFTFRVYYIYGGINEKGKVDLGSRYSSCVTLCQDSVYEAM